LFFGLLDAVDWREERIRMFGRTVTVPRLVSWCGDAGLSYRYSGLEHRCAGWLPLLEPVRSRIARECGFASSMVLLNRYRDGGDSMGWHTDDEAGQGPWLASLSLGASRRFLLRPRSQLPAVRLDLGHGSLLLFRGAMPHALPKTARPIGERINLTFRQCPAPGLPDA
jgi:alkylated DNA repair dioxygenase AlkB